MRNMLAFLAAVALTVIGVGWYLDWFKVHSVPASSGHRALSIDVDTNKVSHDLLDAEHKIEKRLADKSESAGHDINPLSKVNPLGGSEPPKTNAGELLPKIDVTIEK
jgi:hypothetical protein